MFIARKYIQEHPNVLFIFGDNDRRVGMGGMAKEFRGEPNTLGVRTKKLPSNKEGSFYSDDEYSRNIEKIGSDCFTALVVCRAQNKTIWIPDRLGMGLADLQNKAPKTLRYLQRCIKIIKEVIKYEKL